MPSNKSPSTPQKAPVAVASATAQQAQQQVADTSNAIQTLWKAYNETTSSRLKLIDAFLVFIMLSGIVQFVYCILVTNFPFNAFLAGYVSLFSSWSFLVKQLSHVINTMFLDLEAASGNSC
jgi:uncharacterized membrane protein